LPFGKTLRDEDLHPPALGADHVLAETAINGLSPIASDELPVKPSRAVRPDLRFQIEGWEDSDGQCPPSLRVVLGGALLESLGDDPIVGINALDHAGAAQGLQPAHTRLGCAARRGSVGVVLPASSRSERVDEEGNGHAYRRTRYSSRVCGGGGLGERQTQAARTH
jgi:hypothetical protein